MIFLDLLQWIFFQFSKSLFSHRSVCHSGIKQPWNVNFTSHASGGLTKRARVVLSTEHKAALTGVSGSRQTAWLLTYQCLCSSRHRHSENLSYEACLFFLMHLRQISGGILGFQKPAHCYLLTVYNWGVIAIFMHFDSVLSIYSFPF